jgi:hypothetical protein
MMVENATYEFLNGYPTPETIQRAYYEADLGRAIEAYRFFYPSVSIMATWKGNLNAGMVPNEVFGILKGTPQQLVFTPNSDTPYAGLVLDVSKGPMVIEIPPGPIMGTVNDLNQLHVLDFGLPGPAGAKGGKHVVCSPDYEGEIPSAHYAAKATTNRALALVRAMPQNGDVAGAIEFIKSVKVYPLNDTDLIVDPKWIDLSELKGADFTPLQWEDNIAFWEVLHELVNDEPLNPTYRTHYGNLAELGIANDKPFAPDARMKEILTQAAVKGHAQMCVQSFADRRPERNVWDGSQWEWATLRPENGTFETTDFIDLYAREKWFFQAQIESPAMFSRAPGAGSLYWLGLRDSNGDYLDGANSYTLKVPQPVPAKLFWSVTVYDAYTRSEIATDQDNAALRSTVELKDAPTDKPLRLHFGPTPPDNNAAQNCWIKTAEDRGWFVYFRIYGPEAAAFNGNWQLPDFQRSTQ